MGGPPAAANPAQTAGIILLVCAVAILIGTFTHGWMSGSDDGESVGFGLWSIKGEARGQSMAFSWGELNDMGAKIPFDIRTFGPLGFLAGLAAAVACGAAGAAALTRNLAKLPTKPMLGVMSAAAGLQTFFLVRLLTEDSAKGAARGAHIGISYSPFLAIGGLIAAGFVFKQLLTPHINAAKAAQPAALPGAQAMGAPMMGQPMGGAPMGGAPMGGAPMAQAATMTCPRCQGQAAFVAQYNRYFCNACQQYV